MVKGAKKNIFDLEKYPRHLEINACYIELMKEWMNGWSYQSVDGEAAPRVSHFIERENE